MPETATAPELRHATPASSPGPNPTVAEAVAPARSTRRARLTLTFSLLAALLLLLWLFEDILTPFVLAGAIAYFLDPLATRLTRLGLPRALASTLLIAALAALVLLAMLLLYPLLVAQIGTLLQRLPSYALSVRQAMREALAALSDRLGPDVLDSRLQDLAVAQAGAVVSFLGGAATHLIGRGFALFNILTLLVVTPVVAFYLLRDWPRLLARLDAWLPRRSAGVLRQLAREADRVLSAWLRGQLLCCALLAVYYAVALSAVGLELGLSLGILAGILSFIPYVGSFVGLLAGAVLALAQFGSWSGVITVLLVFLCGQLVEGYVIYPRLLSGRVELHAVWVLFALFASGVAFGFLGVILAVPIAAAIGVVARYWLGRYLHSPLYLEGAPGVEATSRLEGAAGFGSASVPSSSVAPRPAPPAAGRPMERPE